MAILPAIPGTPHRDADLTLAFRREEIYKHLVGAQKWIAGKLPNCQVSGTIDREGDGWVCQLVVRPIVEKEGD